MCTGLLLPRVLWLLNASLHKNFSKPLYWLGVLIKWIDEFSSQHNSPVVSGWTVIQLGMVKGKTSIQSCISGTIERSLDTCGACPTRGQVILPGKKIGTNKMCQLMRREISYRNGCKKWFNKISAYTKSHFTVSVNLHQYFLDTKNSKQTHSLLVSSYPLPHCVHLLTT